MQRLTRALRGGAVQRRTAAGVKRTRSAAPGSEPRTRLPFLQKVVTKALTMPDTVGTAAPYRAYPTLPAGTAKQPEGSTVLYKDARCVLVNDAFPKSTVHCLVMPLDLSIRSLNDLRFDTAAVTPGAARGPTAEPGSTTGASRRAALSSPGPAVEGTNHVELLTHMDAVAQGYVRYLKSTGAAAFSHRRFITGFHALPSLPMLHMHLISMDLDSLCLKTKRHYNSFATFFFLTTDRVIDDLRRNGRVTINQNVQELEKLESQGMTCLWCGEALATVPAMKAHVRSCSQNKATSA